MALSQLRNKVAIVTGSSSGLGEAIAIMFASRGAKVTLCGRDVNRLKSIFDRAVQASGGYSDRFLTQQGDVNQHDVRRDIVAQTIQKFGCLDILVANAGTAAPNCDITSATEESYDMIMNTNLKSVFFLIQQAVPHLEKSKGNIVCISSMLSTLPSSPSLIYPMSKAALDHLVNCLALDLAPRGIRINTVNPSFVPTRIRREFDGVETEKEAAKWAAAEMQKQPMAGRIGTADEVAEAVTFLVSDAASFITGQHIRVDGGRSLNGPYGQPPRPPKSSTENQ